MVLQKLRHSNVESAYGFKKSPLGTLKAHQRSPGGSSPELPIMDCRI